MIVSFDQTLQFPCRNGHDGAEKSNLKPFDQKSYNLQINWSVESSGSEFLTVLNTKNSSLIFISFIFQSVERGSKRRSARYAYKVVFFLFFSIIFESQYQFCDSMFSSISLKEKIKKFFWETEKFYVSYVFWTQAIILWKVVWRPASCGQNFNQEKVWFQIISKSFDRYTLYLVWW